MEPTLILTFEVQNDYGTKSELHVPYIIMCTQGVLPVFPSLKLHSVRSPLPAIWITGNLSQVGRMAL